MEKYSVREVRLAVCSEKLFKLDSIVNSISIYNFITQIWKRDIDLIERFLLINLNRKHEVISYHWISQGGLAGTVIDMQIIFKSAIESLASSIAVAHNHPSGNMNPSGGDKSITKKLLSASKLLDIQLLDHLIITKDYYFSFADSGLLKD